MLIVYSMFLRAAAEWHVGIIPYTMRVHSTFCRQAPSFLRKPLVMICATGVLFLNLAGCEVERRKSDAELGLNTQQAAGRRVYDAYCDRCHAPYSSKNRQGPSLKSMFKKQYLEESGMPANDDRVTDIVQLGRDKMPGFGQVLNQQQIDDLLAYLHTL